MAARRRKRGPISKAIARGEGLSKGIQIAAQNYQMGVSAAGDRWVEGMSEFLRYFVPKVMSKVKEARSRYPDDPRARLEFVLNAESEIAKEYDSMAENRRIDKIAAAFGGSAVASVQQPAMAQAVAVSKRKEIRI